MLDLKTKVTPWKMNGWEPENHLFEKENHRNQTSIFGFHVNFQGCNFCWDLETSCLVGG